MSNKLKLGTVDLKTAISGVEVVLPTQISIQIITEDNQIKLNSESIIELSDLQGKVLQLLRTLPLPPVSGYGPQAEVTSIDSASMSASGDSMVLEVAISCKAWEITRGLPYCTPIWKRVCINTPFGEVCTNIPNGIECGNGDDIKLHLFNEGATAKLRLGLSTPDGKSIDIVPLETEAYPRGDLGRFANWLLTFVKGDLNHLVTGQIRDLVNDGMLRQTLPQNMNKFNPVIKTIQFLTTESGALGLLCKFQASLSEDQLNEIVSQTLVNP